MPLSKEFSEAIAKRTRTIENDDIILFKEKGANGDIEKRFDFMLRCLTTTYFASRVSTYSNGYAAMTGNVTVTPFNQLDRDMLENIYAYMIEKNYKPVPLPKRDEDGGDTFSFKQAFGK